MESREEWYKKEFLRFESGKSRESSKMDNAIFLVSTGTLVLSINYIINLKDFSVLNPLLLISSWVLLLLSILTHIMGYYCSKTFHETYMDELNDWIRGPAAYFSKSKKTIQYEKSTKILTNLSLIFLVLGLVFVTCFTTINFYFS